MVKCQKIALHWYASSGVGRKTANVVLNTAGWPTIAVDTHIYRVSNRTKLAMGKTVDDVEAKLLKVVPKEFKLMSTTGSFFMDATLVSRVSLAAEVALLKIQVWV